MSPLAEAVYDVLRCRPGQPDPRITYAQLAAEVRESSADLDYIHHRNRQLYEALGEVEEECSRLGLPSLAALVVRADSRRPGDAYFQGHSAQFRFRGEQVEAWRRELEAVKGAVYPPRARSETGRGRGTRSRQRPLAHSGHARKAISATPSRCSRLAPPAAWTAMP